MNKIIHIEDDPKFRKIISGALEKISETELIQVADLHSFFTLEQGYEADLYIIDRHFPPKKGVNSDDVSWRTLAGHIKEIYPGKSIIMLSSRIPENKDWRSYTNIRKVLDKIDFNPEQFRKIVKRYLIAEERKNNGL